MTDILQIIGALLVLGGFAAAQLGWVGARTPSYLVVNIAGAGLLAWLAWHDRDWGFLLLEGVWTLVSVLSLTRVAANRRSARSVQSSHQ